MTWRDSVIQGVFERSPTYSAVPDSNSIRRPWLGMLLCRNGKPRTLLSLSSDCFAALSECVGKIKLSFLAFFNAFSSVKQIN